MPTDQGVFSNTQPTDQTTDESKQQDVKLFDSLVGQGRKFQDAEALARGKQEADNFIEQLKREKAQLLEDLSARKTAEDIAKQLRDEFSSLKADEGAPATQPQDIAKLVENIMSNRETTQTRTSNLKSLEDAMVAKFGTMDKARTALEAKATELGTNPNYLEETAATSPKAFRALMGLDPVQTLAKPPVDSTLRNDLNTQARPPVEDSARLREHYLQLRKEKPSEYYSPKIQMEIFNLMKAGQLDMS